MIDKIDELKAAYGKFLNDKDSKQLLVFLKNKNNASVLFTTSVCDSKIQLSLIFEIFCNKNVVTNEIRLSIIDLFTELTKYRNACWILINYLGFLETIFEQASFEDDTEIKEKMLRAIIPFLIFQHNEKKSFPVCCYPCCDLRRNVVNSKPNALCKSLAKSLVRFGSEMSADQIEIHLVVLSLIYRNYSIEFSPDSCGNSETFSSLKGFLLDGLQSQRFSVISNLTALSCFYFTTDIVSMKLFTDKNFEYTVAFIEQTVMKNDDHIEYTSGMMAMFLLNDMLQNPHITHCFEESWRINQFKTICKAIMAYFRENHLEIGIQLFFSINKFPELCSTLEKYLTNNSKLLQFLVKLITAECDHAAILALKLVNKYSKPEKLPQEFSRDFITIMINCVRVNLEKLLECFSDDDHNNNRLLYRESELLKRQLYLRCHRVWESLELLLNLLASDRLSNTILSMCGGPIVSIMESVIQQIMSNDNNLLISLEPYNVDTVLNHFCESKTWLLSGVRIAIDIAYFIITIAAKFSSNQVISKTIEQEIQKPAFAPLLAACFTHGGNDKMITRALFIAASCAQSNPSFGDWLSKYIEVNCRLLAEHHCCSVNDDQSYISFGNEQLCTNNSDGVKEIVESWIRNKNKEFMTSEAFVILREHVNNLTDRQKQLENALQQKEEYLRQYFEQINDYRSYTLRSDATIERLNESVIKLQFSNEQFSQLVKELKTECNQKAIEIAEESRQLIDMSDRNRLLEQELYETKLQRKQTMESLEKTEAGNDKLRNLVEQMNKTMKDKDNELESLKRFKMAIFELSSNKITPDKLLMNDDINLTS